MKWTRNVFFSCTYTGTTVFFFLRGSVNVKMSTIFFVTINGRADGRGGVSPGLGGTLPAEPDLGRTETRGPSARAPPPPPFRPNDENRRRSLSLLTSRSTTARYMDSCTSRSILNASRANATTVCRFRPVFSEPMQCSISCSTSSYSSLIWNTGRRFTRRAAGGAGSVVPGRGPPATTRIPTVMDSNCVSHLVRISSFFTPRKLKCLACALLDFIVSGDGCAYAAKPRRTGARRNDDRTGRRV